MGRTPPDHGNGPCCPSGRWCRSDHLWRDHTSRYRRFKIPGGFFKREGRPSEKETLTSRLIDRPIRPLFADGYKNETQIVLTVLSHDLENDPDIVALVGASAALTISGVPFMGPIGGARVGYIDGEYVLNPPIDSMEDSKLDLIVAGTSEAVLMVESEAQELSEEIMLGAVMFGHRELQPVIEAIIQLAEKAAKVPRDHVAADHSALYAKVKDLVEADLNTAYDFQDKEPRRAAISEAKAKVMEALLEDGASPDDKGPWLLAVHTRRNPGAGGGHSGHL